MQKKKTGKREMSFALVKIVYSTTLQENTEGASKSKCRTTILVS